MLSERSLSKDQASNLLDRRVFRVALISALVAAVAYLMFALLSGWSEVVSAVKSVGWYGIIIAISLSLLNYSLRFCRWQIYLEALDHPIRSIASLKIYLAGFALTTTPGKIGEALRGVLLSQFGVPFTQSLAAFVSERISDLFAVLLLVIFGLSIYPDAWYLVATSAVGLIIAFYVLCSEALLSQIKSWIKGDSRVKKILKSIVELTAQAQRCHSFSTMVKATVLGIAAWSAEAFAFHLILGWMGIDTTLAFSFFVFAISMLAGALSFMPGGLGGAEAMMIFLLVRNGVDSPEAIAATLLIRLTTLWFAVSLGALVLATYNKNRISIS